MKARRLPRSFLVVLAVLVVVVVVTNVLYYRWVLG